ncbi:MAG: AtpZ/AtpI family protein [Candidatus Omnitrophota bacterium]
MSFIPFVLAAGPIAGYLAGEYLIKKFGLPSYISFIFAAVGFAASIRETIRIIRIAIKTDKEF